MSLIKISLITSLLVLLIACGSDPAPASASVDIEATVEARVAKELGRATPTPKPMSSSKVSKSEEIQIKDLIKGLRKATVSRVIDGDTIELSSGERIRYLEVSTPEMRPLECYAQEATRKNSELVLGKTIYIQPPTEGNKTSYNRTLAYVFTDEYFVFLELVKNGYAIVELYAAPNEFYDLLKQAENDARSNKRGLWGKCYSLSPKPTPKPNVKQVPATKSSSISTPVPTRLSTGIPGASLNYAWDGFFSKHGFSLNLTKGTTINEVELAGMKNDHNEGLLTFWNNDYSIGEEGALNWRITGDSFYDQDIRFLEEGQTIEVSNTGVLTGSGPFFLPGEYFIYRILNEDKSVYKAVVFGEFSCKANVYNGAPSRVFGLTFGKSYNTFLSASDKELKDQHFYLLTDRFNQVISGFSCTESTARPAPTSRPTATPRPIPTATPRPVSTATATKNASDFNLEGSKFFNAKDYSRAIQSFSKAIELSKDYTSFDRAIFYFNRGNSEYNSFNYVAAIRDFSEAIKLNPNKEHYFLLKGYSYHFLKQYENAVNDYNKVLEINPNNTDAITNKKDAMEQIRLRPTPRPIPTVTATPVDGLPISRYDKHGFSLTILDYYGDVKFEDAGWTGDVADTDQGFLSISKGDMTAIMIWGPDEGLDNVSLVKNMFDLLAFNLAKNQSMESISKGELNAGSTAEDIPGNFGGYKVLEGENSVEIGLIGAWICTQSSTTFSIAVKAKDTNSVQIRFDEFISGFSCK